MNFKIQILAACASLLLASSAVALPTPARVAKAHKNVPAIVPAAPHDVLANVGADVTPIATVDASFGPVNPLQAALDFAQQRLTTTGSPFTEYIVKDSYTTKHNGMTHVYLRQVVNGLEVINGDMNINVMADGSILSSGNSFFAGQYAPEIADNFMPTMSPAQALEAFSRHIGEELPSGFFGSGVEEDKIDDKSAILRNVPYALSDVPARLVYVQDGNALKLGWELTVEMDNNWFYTVVDAREASVLAVNDWVSQALPTYNVLPFGVEDPTFGNRELVSRTSNSKASPLGWHDDGSKKYTTTEGNNVDARSRSAILLGTNRRPDGGSDLLFDLPADFSKGSPKDYHLAAVAQLFHTVNRYHDLTYLLGFDEVSGNFQTNNFGKGGKGSDAVIANAQDPSGTNNANFATPVDGSAGKMNMFIFTQTTPNRDGDFQQGIVIHEYTHGVSTRLTGGPANSNCLPSGESGGMGEGWGDAFGAALSILPTDTRNTKITMGAWVMGNSLGVRKYAYSSDLSVDPETYGYLKKSGYSEVHAIGEVWAGILNEVYWNLHEAKGWQQDIFDIDVSTPEARAKAKGNVIYMLNLIDGMKAQPCKPSFVDARNAILAADKANFDGANVCLMWKGFAKRGLGVNAKAGGTEDFTVPTECK